jgi:hypothetical protein
MMEEIILSENCFGPDVVINGESLFIHEYDNRDPKIIEDLQNNLISKLQELKVGMGMNDWTTIAEIVVSLCGEYEYDEENSIDYSSCDQCGNWNHKKVYKKINEKNSKVI